MYGRSLSKSLDDLLSVMMDSKASTCVTRALESANFAVYVYHKHYIRDTRERKKATDGADLHLIPSN